MRLGLESNNNNDVANLSRSDMEDPDQPLNKAFEEKTNLHADNALANDVDNMPAIVSCVGRIHPSLLKFMYEQLTFHAKKGSSDSFVESKVQSKMTYWKQKLSWLLTRRISITTIFRSDLLLRNFHVNDQHIQIFDGSMDADSDSCVLNNFFDVRKEWIFTVVCSYIYIRRYVVVVVVVRYYGLYSGWLATSVPVQTAFSS